MHRHSSNLQAVLTGEMLKGRESKQPQD